MHFSTLLAVTAAAVVEAANQGFNYGATNSDGSIKHQQDFLNEFNRAKNLPGTSGFTSARLYTMVQGGTANTVSSAIPAAIASNTGLLLGLWASAGQSSFDNEVTALKNAISQYGTSFTNLIEGISVGSEDLYRNSPTGILNKSGYGAQPQDLVNYIAQVRAAIAGTAAAGKSIGHVDTWTSYVNGSNAAVINAVDWLGVDGYPYFQNTQSNGIENGASLFFESYDAVKAVSGGKDVWITETGWPVSGPTENLAVASAANAEKYWQDVACRVLGNINTYWYTLQDAYPVTPAPSFGIIGTDLNSAPLYDLTCNASTSSSSSSVVASSSTASSSAVSSSTSSSSAVSSSSTLSTSVASPTQPTTAAGTSTVSLATNPGAESTASVPTSVNTFATTVAQSTGTAPVVVTSTAVTSVRGTTSAQNTAPVSGTTSSATPSASVQPSTGGAGSPHTFTSFTTTLVTVTACPGLWYLVQWARHALY